MNFRRLWRRFSNHNGVYFLLGFLLLVQKPRPWVDKIIQQLGLWADEISHEPRDRLLRMIGWSVALSIVVVGLLRGRTLWPAIRAKVVTFATTRRPRTVRDTNITPPSGAIHFGELVHASPPDLPPGTPAAVAMANLAQVPRPAPRNHQGYIFPGPQFVNNTNWMTQHEVAHHQQATVAHFATAAPSGYYLATTGARISVL